MRKNMVSPTNAILTGLAVADMLVMVDYIPFSIHNHIRHEQPPTELYSYPWTVFTFFHAHFSVVFHSISTWLTILLAVWRLLSVSYPTRSRTWFTMRSAIISIISIYLIVPIFCIPMYLSFTISPVEDTIGIYYRIDWSELSLKNDKFLKNLNFWVFSVGTKLVPCILLTYFSLAIIKILIEADKRKARLRSSYNNNSKPDLLTPTATGTGTTINDNTNDSRRWSCSPACDPASTINEATNKIELCQSKKMNNKSKRGSASTGSQLDNNNLTNSSQQQHLLHPDYPHNNPSPQHQHHHHSHHHNHHHESSQAHDRTTRLLLAVLLIFLLTELPGGILIVLSVFLGENFFQTVYSPLGDLLDILALINSAINFILYCTMSRQFRITFRKIFCQIGDNEETDILASRHNVIVNKSANHVIYRNGKSEVTFV
ncbi:uncharacterized protein LOC107370176 isoform X2 [Tetranychus urticae]|uniref:uncharacterized protein LOC107370176 isoform X2 n=1 Tax=Tetranychus urticae TaxID=32264 RepID=UPI00077BCBB4|nr:uncharacterized protein LOC107370176 isoform X2 [Tetranychus urticae]